MARAGTKEPLPPPLPPEERTVGQLVAETLKLYGRRFWASLALGVGPAIAAIAVTVIHGWWALAIVLTFGVLVMTASYVRAVLIATGESVARRPLLTGVAAGCVVFLPVPFLYSVVLPAVAWLALFGLAVPVALVEGLGFVASLRRGFQLARADLVHSIGSLATLGIVLLSDLDVLSSCSGAGARPRSRSRPLSVRVISPVVVLGAALLYFDQAARATKRRTRCRRTSCSRA